MAIGKASVQVQRHMSMSPEAFLLNWRSYGIPGSELTNNSISAPSNALPRLRTLCTNSKKLR